MVNLEGLIACEWQALSITYALANWKAPALQELITIHNEKTLEDSPMRSVMMTCGDNQSEQAPDNIFPAAHHAISAIHRSPPTIQK
jgi:hypothetical protein